MTGDSSRVTIIEPGIVKTIDGKEYFNPERIIAGHPDDVEAYHAIPLEGIADGGEPYTDEELDIIDRR